MPQSTQPRVSLEEELSTLSAELIDAFMMADAQTESQTDIREVLKSYIKHVTRCGLCAGRSGLYELQDYFVQFQTILKSLAQHPPEVINQYRTVLEQWPLLVMSYMNSTDNADFMLQIEGLLNNTHWPDEGNKEKIVEEIKPTEAISIKPEATEQPAEQVSQLLHDGLLEEFNQCLEELVSLNHDEAGQEFQNVKRVLTETATRLELLGVSAASAGFVGLMDVAQILQTGLRTRSYTPELLSEQEWGGLFTLKIAIEAYLKSPLDHEVIDKLIDAVQTFSINEALPEEEVKTLRSLFTLQEPSESPLDNDINIDGDGTLAETVSEAEVVAEDTLTETPDINHQDASDQLDEAAQQTLTDEIAELLGLISAEFENVIPSLGENLQRLCDIESDTDKRTEAIKQYVALLERFSSVAESIGLIGLNTIFTRLIENFSQHTSGDIPTTEQQMWLLEWPAYVQNYLTDPFQHASELLQHCQSQDAVFELADEVIKELEQSLKAPNLALEEEDTEPRQTQAEAKDVSLQLPEDVNQQLLDSLLQELPQHTAEFSRAIASMINGEGSLKDVELAQRVAHTLKGSANTVGVTGIATLTHHIEDILTAFSKQQQLPQAPLTTTLQDAADVLEMMSESLLGMGTLPEQQSLDVLQQVLDWANQIEQSGLPESGQEVMPRVRMDEDNETMPTPELIEQTTLRVSTLTIDEILRLVGEGIITNGQLHESLSQIVTQNRVIQEQSALFQQLVFELEQLIDIRGINKYLSSSSDSRFDALEMDQYNELHTLTRRLVEAATDSREMAQAADDDLKHLEFLLHSQSRIEKDTQELVMKTRMLPVQNIVPRLQRSVRQVCRQTGKDVELELIGSETLIDSDILTMLADPLMHLLRNAVDHGIETAELRKQTGKPAKGHIKLDFNREGEYIRIRCIDDGAGLDLGAIENIALEKGLITKASELSESELSRLILIAGFTTRDETTQVSGRGIGMDAVYNQILKLKGTLRIENKPGEGVNIEIQLPVTLITLHGIMVEVRGQDLALSNRGVAQILHNNAGIISEENKQLYYQYDDEKYKAYYVEDLLGMMRQKRDINDVNCSALVVNGEDGKQYVVLVGKITATQDIVIKKLGPYVPAIAGIEGATILGGGSVAPVIDLPGLFKAFQGTSYVPIIESSEITGIQSGTPKVLVVDDSLSARRSLAEFMQDIGYRVVTARDGMDAVDKLEQESPDVLLVDMEMPRMNGLELTSYVRANPATHNLPIIMITSRATDKHRDEADKAGVNAYLVKPYSENEVLDKVEAQLKRAFAIEQTATS